MQNIQENGRYESMRKNIQYVEIMFFAFYCAQDNCGVKKILTHSKNPSKSPTMCFARIKNYTSCTMRNSDALIVKNRWLDGTLY
jgi:hypothetical protein